MCVGASKKTPSNCPPFFEGFFCVKSNFFFLLDDFCNKRLLVSSIISNFFFFVFIFFPIFPLFFCDIHLLEVHLIFTPAYRSVQDRTVYAPIRSYPVRGVKNQVGGVAR